MGERVAIVRQDVRIRVDDACQSLWLDLATFSQPLRISISADTLDAFDCGVSVAWDGVTHQGDHERLSWTSTSTLWQKRYHLDIHGGHLEFHGEFDGRGAIDCFRFFDTIPAAGFRPHFALTKHFNDSGATDARDYALGSPVKFSRVLCPEPNSYARQQFPASGYSQISVNADLDYCGGNFVANPGLLCFAVAADPEREWLALGLAIEPGEYHFSEYEYLGGEDFALRINGWGARSVSGTFRTPRIVLAWAHSAEAALGRYVDVLRGKELVPTTRRGQPSWWSRPIVCGWGHQSYQADLFRIRSSAERQPDNAAYTLSTQTNYTDLLGRLDAERIPWGTVVIDARWFLAGGLKDVDVGRWPDMRAFIQAQHRRGRRVLLWWSAWDPEGVPPEQCVRYQPDGRCNRQNRAGRLAKFGVPVPGKKLAVDVTIPETRERIRDQVRLLLSPGPSGYDADGFKLDHLSAAPGMYGMVFPDGSGRLFGIEALREYMRLLYTAAKETKSDALIVGQSPNPYLSDVQDMLRLGDIYTRNDETVVAEMSFRAAMARIVDTDWLIDTDGWPMPSLTALREYVGVQPTLGVPSLYYATHIDTTGEALGPDVYARIRHAWST